MVSGVQNLEDCHTVSRVPALSHTACIAVLAPYQAQEVGWQALPAMEHGTVAHLVML